MTPLDRIHLEVRTCRNCRLCESRTHAVPGEGPPDAKVLVLGEAPGQMEDEAGRPFVGPSGALLRNLLNRAGVVNPFITNVVRCRPPGNRDPSPDEMKACRTFTDRQFTELRPNVVITAGRFATWQATRQYGPLDALMEQELSWFSDPETRVVPIYHPSYLLRMMSDDKVKAKELLQATIERIASATKS